MTGRTGKRIETHSLSTRRNIEVISEIMRVEKPAKTLEIGLALGASALTITSAHRNLGPAGIRMHYAIDPFQDTVWDGCGELNVDLAGLSEYMKTLNKFSASALPQMIDEGLSFDFIYIDGSHLFEDVFVDIYFSARVMTKGGLMLLDDCSDAHVRKAIGFVQKNMAHTLQEIDLSPFQHRSRLDKIKHKIAKKLGRTQLRAFRSIGDPVRPWNAPLKPF
ncbi:Methyltransferase domain-containing protein [Loktanella sp. DSM 29012]|nr:Methyltransferase domain-containing protein [Loktanella sp. DSM 29012]